MRALGERIAKESNCAVHQQALDALGVFFECFCQKRGDVVVDDEVPQFLKYVEKRKSDVLEVVIDDARLSSLDDRIFLQVVLEEVFTLSVQNCLTMSEKVVVCRHVQVAIIGDEDLAKIFDAYLKDEEEKGKKHPLFGSERWNFVDRPFVVVSGAGVDWSLVEELCEDDKEQLRREMKHLGVGAMFSFATSYRCNGSFCIVEDVGVIDPIWNALEKRMSTKSLDQNSICILPSIVVVESNDDDTKLRQRCAIRIHVDSSGYGVLRGDIVKSLGLRKCLQMSPMVSVVPIQYTVNTVELLIVNGVEGTLVGVTLLDVREEKAKWTQRTLEEGMMINVALDPSVVLQVGKNGDVSLREHGAARVKE